MLSTRIGSGFVPLSGKQDEKQRGGADWYVVRRHRIGNALIELVRRGVEAGDVPPTRAAKILGVKPMAVYNLLFAPARPRAA